MGIVELLLGVVFAVCVGIGVSMTPSALTAGEFWVARICFVIAACSLCAAYIYWVFDGNRSGVIRIILGIIVGILAIAGTTESILWVNNRERMRDKEMAPPESPEQATEKAPLDVIATTSAAVRQPGTIIGGIPWRSSYGDLRVRIYNGADFDYQRVDLAIVPDVAVTAVAQLTNIPGASVSLNKEPSTSMEMVNPSSGERVEMPFSIVASSLGYRLRCERLPSHASIELIMAAVSMNDGKPSLEVDNVVRVNFSNGKAVWSAHRDHTEKIFGAKPVPRLVEIAGRYTAQQTEHKVSARIVVKDFISEAMPDLMKAIQKPSEMQGTK